MAEWRGNETIKRLLVDIDTLTLDPENARRDHDVDAIAASLRKHGQQQVAVVSKDSRVLIGNGRIKAARKLKWSQFAVMVFTGNETEARSLSIRDNRTTELSEWDYEILLPQLEGLEHLGVDTVELGWTEDELASMFGKDGESPDEFPTVKSDIAGEHCCPKCGYTWSGRKS